MFEVDRSMCPKCGMWLTLEELAVRRHECEPTALLAFQTRLARAVLDRELESTVEVWERDPRLANRLAFARYLRERSIAEDARRAA